MKQETKFSVIMPGSHFTSAQIADFEAIAQKYGIPVMLPLRSDGNGNLIAASSMTLRDAQGLRRQIAGCGYPADVVSDMSESQQKAQMAPSVEADVTIDVDAILNTDGDASAPSFSSIEEIASDVFSSIDMPSLDLGLSDASKVDFDELARMDEAWNGGASREQTLSLDVLSAVEVSDVAEEGISVDVLSDDLQQEAVTTVSEAAMVSDADETSSAEDKQVLEAHKEEEAKSAISADAEPVQSAVTPQDTPVVSAPVQPRKVVKHEDGEAADSNGVAVSKRSGGMRVLVLGTLIIMSIGVVLILINRYVVELSFVEKMIKPLF